VFSGSLDGLIGLEGGRRGRVVNLRERGGWNWLESGGEKERE